MAMAGCGYAGVAPMYGEAMRPARLSALFLSALALIPCARAEDALPAWDYIGGANDDEDWGLLSPAYAKCTVGTAQSPVAIDETQKTSMLPMQFDYKASEAVEQWRELSLILQFKDGNTLRSEGTEYRLRQVRFHTPAEHDIKGVNLPLEMQFIHESADKQVLVVAVQAVTGAANAALQTVVEALPHKGAPEKTVQVDVAGLLPKKRGYYAYEGSLSWPPCTEGVQWRVMKEPITLSKDQLRALGLLLGRNARLSQPIYFRHIKETQE